MRAKRHQPRRLAGARQATAAVVGALGLVRDLIESEVEEFGSLALNCLRRFPDTGPVIWRDRTMTRSDGSNDERKYVPVCRLAFFIEHSIDAGTRWAVFEPNGPALWNSISGALTAFLHRFLLRAPLPERPRSELLCAL